MRVLGAVALATMLGACTSVKMVQRDGCWIKRTEKVFGRVREEIGPCTRAQPKWAEHQLTRLVQECVAQADWRWQVRAMEAWSKAKPFPSQPPQEETLRTCMQEARVGLVNENDELKRKVSDLVADRDALKSDLVAERTALRTDAEHERTHLRASNDRIAGFLGEAAQRPPSNPNVTATASATGEGKATNDSGATLSSGSSSDSGAAPTLTASSPAAAPAEAPVQTAAARPKPIGGEKAAAPARTARSARPATHRRAPPGCELPVAQPEARAAAPAAEGGAP